MSRWYLKALFWLVGILFFLLMFVLPLLSSVMVNSGYRMPANARDYLETIHWLQSKTMHAFTFAWIFFLGSCFASFLNVVAWRVPRGKSILGSSHCPHCNLKLTFRDNLPIVGWLRNEGKCSSCRTPITIRYLIAELVLGLVFLSLFLREVVTGGINLPFRNVNFFVGIEHILFDPEWSLLAIFGFHLLLLSLLFTFAMIASEKKRVPISILLFGIVSGVATLFLNFDVNLVNWELVDGQLGSQSERSNFVDLPIEMTKAILLGLGTGFFVGLTIHVSARQRDSRMEIENKTLGDSDYQNRLSLIPESAAMLLAGSFLGWQSALSIGCLYFFVTACVLFLRIFDNRYLVVNATGRILLATLLHLALWNLQDNLPIWPGPSSTLYMAICSVIALTLMAAVTAMMAGSLTLGSNESGN